jgi:hypothetical protein
MSVMRWTAAFVLGFGLALAVQWLIGMPDVVLVPVSMSLSYGFGNILASKRLRGLWDETA